MKNSKLMMTAAASLLAVSATASWALFDESAPKKVSQHLLKTLDAEAVPGEFIVKMKAGIGTLGNELQALGLEHKEVVNVSENTHLVHLANPAKMAARVGVKTLAQNELSLRQAVIFEASKIAGVEYIEPNFIYRVQLVNEELPKRLPNDADFNKLWGMQNEGQADPRGREGKVDADIDAPEAWALETGSKDVVVAVVDTGVDYNHPDLKENMWVKPGTDNVHGFNAITGVEDPMDDHSHGTHCSGTIGARGDDGTGVAGVAWDVSIMGVKFLSGSGSGTLADAIKAIDYATENGAHIMSNSWGGGGFSEALKESIERAAAKGILFIAASGNDSSNNDRRPSYPASYEVENVVSVAASNNLDVMSSFSNYGRSMVHLMAPGENVWSSVVGGGYQSYSGTSMATPHVSGAAALLLSKEPSLTPVQVRERLMATSDKLKAYRTKLISGGRLNAYNLITNTIPPGWITIPDEAWLAPIARLIESAHPYGNGEKLSWTITKEGATFLKVHFKKFDTEAGYDVLTIKDGNGEVIDTLSGDMGENFWSLEVEGDTMVLEFESDSSVNDYGFEIDQFTWTTYTGEEN